eukprot:357302-Chlamydomonas_euryale.AAC.3
MSALLQHLCLCAVVHRGCHFHTEVGRYNIADIARNLPGRTPSAKDAEGVCPGRSLGSSKVAPLNIRANGHQLEVPAGRLCARLVD